MVDVLNTKVERPKGNSIVEHEKPDEQIKKKMPCLLTYGFKASLISNIKRKKPSLDEDKNERGKNNEAKITSKSSYQVSVAVVESDANINILKPQQR